MTRVPFSRNPAHRHVVIIGDCALNSTLSAIYAIGCGKFEIQAIVEHLGESSTSEPPHGARDILDRIEWVDLPVLTENAAGRQAGGAWAHLTIVEFLAEILMIQPLGTLDLVALGGIGHLAQLARDYPAAAQRAGSVTLGGVSRVTSPDGGDRLSLRARLDDATTVFQRLGPIRIIPPEITRRVRVSETIMAELENSSLPTTRHAAALIADDLNAPGPVGRTLHGPCLVSALVQPDAYEFEDCRFVLAATPASEPEQTLLVPVLDGPCQAEIAVDVTESSVLAEITAGLQAPPTRRSRTVMPF